MQYLLSDIFEGNYKISQVYGANPAYYKKFGLNGHEGVDWALPVGTRVLNPFAQGIVLRAAWDATYGYYVVIWDPIQRCAVWYCHLSKINVYAGQRLGRFAVVGLSGRSGNVTGPHLHVNFVQTDAYGNRLNMKNGYQGYLNILDGRLVRWTLSR